MAQKSIISLNRDVSFRTNHCSLELSKWHAYTRSERHAGWKVFLPISANASIFTVGLKGSDLASLGRTWKKIYVYKSTEKDLEWANEQAKSLGHQYHFEEVESLGPITSGYDAIAINGKFTHIMDPEKAYRLLYEGGTVIWFGPSWLLPSEKSLHRQGYCNIRKYAILPPTNERVIVPLSHTKLTHAGLTFYAPPGWRNGLSSRIAHLATSIHFHEWLSWNKLVLANKPGESTGQDYLLDVLSDQLGIPIIDMAIYIGWTKLVLQLLSNDCNVVGIAKIADINLGRSRIERETASLRHLEGVAELKGVVPRIMTIGKWGGHTVQVQTWARSSNVVRHTKELTQAHINFFVILSELPSRTMYLKDWPQWPLLRQWVSEGIPAPKLEAEAIRQLLTECADNLTKQKIRFHRIHGDFTPWNAYLGSNGLIVVDWEESDPCGLPLFDAAYFILNRDNDFTDSKLTIKQLILPSTTYFDNRGELKALGSLLNISEEVTRFAAIYAYILARYPSVREQLRTF